MQIHWHKNKYRGIKANNSCKSKTHILSFLTPTLFARLLGDTLPISFKIRKKGRGQKKKLP